MSGTTLSTEASSPPAATYSPIDAATQKADSIIQDFHENKEDQKKFEGKFEELKKEGITLKFKGQVDTLFSTASKITEEKKELEELQSNQNTLTSIIDQLHTNIDEGLGIKRYKSKEKITVPGSDPKHEEAVIIRDARGRGDKKDKKPDDLKETYQLSMASTTRGALKMIEMSKNSTEEKDRLRTALMEELKSSFDSLGEDTTPKERLSKVREFEDRLIKKMADSGIRIEDVKPTELKKMLADTRDMCNLQDEQSHIATVQAVPIKTGTQYGNSIETTSLSVRLSPFSPEIVKDLTALKHDKFKTKSVPWYNALKEREKKLVRDNIDLLIENRQTLPASLRFLPGLRNAYVEAEYCTTQYAHNQQTTERYDLAVRTGTPSYTRGKPDTTTSKNLSHIKKLSGKQLDILMLNHPFGDEKSICSRMKEAVKSVMRLGKLTHIPLQFRLNMQKAAAEIRKFTSKISGKEDIGVYFCKSGKDRTEFSRREGRISMLTAHLNNKISLKTAQDRVNLRKAMQSSYHGETIAGSYGGSHGALGLKISAVKDRFNGPDIIIAEKNKVASLNKFESFAGKMKNSLQKLMPKRASKLQVTKARTTSPSRS